MLRIKSAQFFNGKYRDNVSGITTQCENCGKTHDDAQGQLMNCEHCQAQGLDNYYCQDCYGYHEQQHFNNEADPMLSPLSR